MGIACSVWCMSFWCGWSIGEGTRGEGEMQRANNSQLREKMLPRVKTRMAKNVMEHLLLDQGK